MDFGLDEEIIIVVCVMICVLLMRTMPFYRCDMLVLLVVFVVLVHENHFLIGVDHSVYRVEVLCSCRFLHNYQSIV